LAVADSDLILHKIKAGETVSSIARRYGVPQHMVALWNNLDNLGHIRAGQQLAIYLDDASFAKKEQEHLATLAQNSEAPASAQIEADDRIIYYHVKQGDTLWAISRQFNLNMDKIRRWNSLTDDVIQPGTRLLIRTASI
jgi:membrane-bound lytic murein transglycosylase D